MQIVFYFGLNAAVTALLGGKLLLQSRLAVIQQQILVVLKYRSQPFSVRNWWEAGFTVSSVTNTTIS